ncbi:MAG: D-aminoacyl-tRNA deacylase [Bacteroidia bacterium]|nr:D-aminoacyl-tRNA deacylase [Bacteroidia bacterium]
MRAVIQRVRQAKVEIEGEIAGEIGPGLLILLGITHDDGPGDVAWLARKITALRIFSDEAGKMNLSVQDTGGSLLVVSQFTLYADSQKGNRPSYTRSAPPETAVPLYEAFIDTLKKICPLPVATGRFGADMAVNLLNDGPVTILLDSKQAL